MSKKISSHLKNIVHKDTQETENGFALTVNEIFEIKQPGRIDFGGGELEEPDLKPHKTTKRNKEDKYSWWELEQGQFLLEYNEELMDLQNNIAVIQSREELLEKGAFHPTLKVNKIPKIPLSVANNGIRIKENARVSNLRIEKQ